MLAPQYMQRSSWREAALATPPLLSRRPPADWPPQRWNAHALSAVPGALPGPCEAARPPGIACRCARACWSRETLKHVLFLPAHLPEGRVAACLFPPSACLRLAKHQHPRRLCRQYFAGKHTGTALLPEPYVHMPLPCRCLQMPVCVRTRTCRAREAAYCIWREPLLP